MGLFDFFRKPKWKHADGRVRLAAIEELGKDDLDILLQVIRDDRDEQVRRAALEKLDDPAMLDGLLADGAQAELHDTLRTRQEELCLGLILAGEHPEDEEALLARIRDPRLLARIAVEAGAVATRCLAVAGIGDQAILHEVLLAHCGKKPALAALEKIDDPDRLRELSSKAVNKSARARAAEKLRILEVGPEEQKEEPLPEPAAPEPSPEAQEEEQAADPRQSEEKLRLRREICDQLDQLARTPGEDGTARLAALRTKWPGDEPGDDGELVALAARFASILDRAEQACAAREEELQALAGLEKRCGELERLLASGKTGRARTLLADLRGTLDAGSWQWVETAPLGTRLEECASELEQSRRKEEEEQARRQQNLEACAGICKRLEALCATEDRHGAEKEVRELQQRWRELAAGENDPDLKERYREAVDIFWERQKQFYKEKEWERWTNKTKKEELCALVESFRDEEDLRAVSRRLKECQAAWKEIGPVPREESDALWERFKSACDEQFERCRVFFAELDRKRQESSKLKERLCKQAEEHVESTEWKESAEILKGLQKQWKEAGPGERDRDEELYTRFRAACDRFFDRRSAWFAEMDAQRMENLKAREQLCEEVEALVREPKLEYGRLIPELQKKWKETGPVPRKHDQEIWQRFRGACDAYYAWLDSCRRDNLAQKVALCEQVEGLLPELEDEERRGAAMETVKGLQQEWKAIGPVPRDEADAVWERFRSTCDLFFAEQKKRIEEEERRRQENQVRKEAILARAGEVIHLDDEKEITAGLQQLQKEWKEIGPAPRDREQELWDEFHGLCNTFFQQKQERYQERRTALDEILRKKEELCFRLERLAGSVEESTTGADDGLDLVERFRIAREANFLLAGKTDDLRKKKEQVRHIQQEWKKLGSTYRDQEQRLWKRYRAAIDRIFAEKKEEPVKD